MRGCRAGKYLVILSLAQLAYSPVRNNNGAVLHAVIVSIIAA
jgi:hypothetical protein